MVFKRDIALLSSSRFLDEALRSSIVARSLELILTLLLARGQYEEPAQNYAKQDDGSVAREAEENARLAAYVPKDNQFSSFPEITAKTAKGLIDRGIKDLFPIQT